MASTIQLKTGTSSAVPANLSQGEVAINIDNGLFYYGSGSGNVTKKLKEFTNITASSHISSSGGSIYGQRVYEMNTSISSIYASVNGNANIITVGALNAGTIEPGFGTIDNGASNITTTGTLSAGQINLNEGQKIIFNVDGNETSFIQGVSNNVRIDADDDLLLYADDDIKIGRGTSDQYAWFYGNLSPDEKKFTMSGSINTLAGGTAGGHITASGNISASGLILGRQYEQIMTNMVYDFDTAGFVYLSWEDTDSETPTKENKFANRAVVVPGKPVKTVMRSPQNHLGANGEAYTMSLWRAPAEVNAYTLVSACHATATGTNREAITFDWRNPNSGSAATLVETGDRILMSLSSSNSQNNANYNIIHLFEWHYDNL